MRVRTSPLLAPAAAIAALAATLLAARTGTPMPVPAPLLGWGAYGVLLAGGTGLLTWHLARLTAVPLSRGGLAAAALPAALLPLAMLPQAGAAALLLPALLALHARVVDPRQRATAGAVLVAVFTAWFWSGAPEAADRLCLGAALAAAIRKALSSAFLPVSNDNPSLERLRDFWRLPLFASYASKSPGDSGYPVLGRVE